MFRLTGEVVDWATVEIADPQYYELLHEVMNQRQSRARFRGVLLDPEEVAWLVLVFGTLARSTLDNPGIT